MLAKNQMAAKLLRQTKICHGQLWPVTKRVLGFQAVSPRSMKPKPMGFYTIKIKVWVNLSTREFV